MKKEIPSNRSSDELAAVTFADGDLPSVRANLEPWPSAEEGVATDLLAVLGGFEQKTGAAVVEFLKSGNGRLVIGGEFRPHGNQVAA